LLAGAFLTSTSDRRAVIAADGLGSPTPYSPPIAGASAEPQQALRAIRVPAGLRLELYAAEPLVANPGAFCFREPRRLRGGGPYRSHKGFTDDRQHMNWLEDDLASRTVDDRVAMYRKYLGKEFAEYGKEHDRIRLLEDRDGDGRADAATVFADGFHDAAVGLG